MDARFVSSSVDQERAVLVLPLVLKDKVAALVYADAGAGRNHGFAALELLVMATGAWLEVISLRKQAQREIGDAPVRRTKHALAPGANGFRHFGSVRWPRAQAYCAECSDEPQPALPQRSLRCLVPPRAGAPRLLLRLILCRTVPGRCGRPSQAQRFAACS